MPDSEIVVITGATAGVGRATALAFAREGARLALLARDPAGLDDTKAEVERLGGQALALPTDVADPEQVEHAADAAEAAFGPIGIWVNDAMVTVFAPIDKISPEEFRRVTEVTYLGAVYGTMAALKRMRPRDRGTIVQVGSALSYRAIPLQAAYCGAKHAMRGFTDAVRSELINERSRIHITMVQLPAVNTPQFDWARNKLHHLPQPLPPIFQPEVMANAIVWSARHRRRELTVGGSSLQVVLGNKVAPGMLDKVIADTAYDGQMRPERAKEERPGNLFAPVPGRHAAHGPFDKIAKTRSLQLWINVHRTLSLIAGLVLLLAIAGGIWWAV
jgi:NAD(P)-dependent dehydrogenase (short-subunit alcohol dehydrogenase family)